MGNEIKEIAKKNAAREAVKLIRDGAVIGIGSGSTVEYAVKFLIERVKNEDLEVYAVPSSTQAYFLLVGSGIRIVTLDEYPELDLAIDGADEISDDLDMIKGGGAALTREKIVDAAAKKLIIVVDFTKRVKRLGERAPVPVEVLPFACGFVMKKLTEMGGKAALRLAQRKVGPIITDNGNFIIDVRFGTPIDDPKELETKINMIPGVVENGIFTNMADIVYVGYKDHVDILRKD
ncbi:MAG: ribose 5-phosphate isomerase A [Candidatus Baldrarchaeia archaeon]